MRISQYAVIPTVGDRFDIVVGGTKRIGVVVRRSDGRYFVEGLEFGPLFESSETAGAWLAEGDDQESV